MKYLILIIILVSIVTRFGNLETLPNGFFVDEASQGYNAYSILKTGRDEYGEFLPLLIRSFATFNPPLYTYLTIPVIYLFDLTIWSVRFLSAATGVGIVILSFLLFRQFQDSLYKQSALVFAGVLALSPWGIFFSRGVLEPNLGLFFFLLGLYLLLKAKTKPAWLTPALLCFGLTGYSYAAYRIIVALTLPVFLILNRKHFLKHKRILTTSVLFLVLLVLPLIALSFTPATSKRFADLDYLGPIFEKYQNKNLLDQVWLGTGELGFEFISRYLTYFSPRSLFFDPDPDLGKSIPEMSVFYDWMIIPFFYGIYLWSRKKKSPEDLLLAAIFLAAPIPAALTRDPFATVRALPLLWSITLVISIGLTGILNKISIKLIKFGLIGLLLLISSFTLYRNYGVLLNFERANTWMYGLEELADRIKISDTAVIDQSRHLAVYANFLFFWKYPPQTYQQQSKIDNYYFDTSFSDKKKIGQVEFKIISWGEDFCQDRIVAGDSLALTAWDVKGHFLTKAFEIKDPRGEVAYVAYKTNPTLACPK